MRQAPSRRLRTCYLLLLIPALMGYARVPDVRPQLPDAGEQLPPDDGGTQLPDAGLPTRDGGPLEPGAPARLKFVAMPARLVAGECQEMTVELQDSSGQPGTASSDTWVALSSNHSTGHFYGPDCRGSPITELFFGLNSSLQKVWYYDTQATDVSLDASESGGRLASDRYGPVPVLPGALQSLQVEGFPPTISALEEHPFSVVAYDAFGNQKSDYTGQVDVWLDDTSAAARVLPASPYTFTAQDRGRANFTARFGVAGTHAIRAQDPTASVSGVYGEISVLPAEAVRFELWEVPSSVQAGSNIRVHLKALDQSGDIAKGYLGKVQFTSTDPKASLPGAVQFTSSDGGMMYVNFSLSTAGTWSLVASDVARPQLQGTASIEVLPAAFKQIVVTPEPSNQQVEACADVKLALKALDLYDNIVPEAHLVVFCTDPATSSATIVENNLSLEPSGSVAGCFVGSIRGTGYVKWRNPQPERVTFKISDKASWSTSLPVDWVSPTFSPAHSTLVFQNSTLGVPQLRSFVGQLGLSFEPRDTCGNLVELPKGKVLSFTGDAPLFFSTPVERDGRWTVDVRLPQCPATGEQPLWIFPTLDQKPVLKPDGTKLKQAVQPVCIPSDVRISLRTEPEGLKQVAPGAVVDFVVEIQNMGQESFLQGLLMFSAKDLTLLEATLDGDGQPLELRNGGFVIRELAPGSTLTIRAKAQAAVAAELSAGATAWYANAEGAALTERVDLVFEPPEGLVDVGCGCQAGPLSSQLLPLLAWLAALSRARARSRRVRPGERIDP